MTPAFALSLTNAIADWVEDRSDLRALGLVGSWAKGTARADSDLDLLVLADAPTNIKPISAGLLK
jgi:predicted nucleotidyltransferase